MKPGHSFFGLLGLLAASCAGSGSEPDSRQDYTFDRNGEEFTVLRIPHIIRYPDTIQLTVEVPSKALEPGRGPANWQFVRQDYKTGEFVRNPAEDAKNLIYFHVASDPIDKENETYQSVERYDDVEARGMRFGLIYKPILAGDRPEFLLKRGYFKPGVAGREFYIRCHPSVGPGSIAPPENCVMEFVLGETLIDDRYWGARIITGFPAERLADWTKIEQRARELFEGGIALNKVGV